MKRIFMIAAMLAATLAIAVPAQADWNRSHFGHGGYHYQHHHGYHYFPGRHGAWHDTSHYHYHPGYFQRHWNHYHYVPGHYHLHRSGHYHRHFHHW